MVIDAVLRTVCLNLPPISGFTVGLHWGFSMIEVAGFDEMQMSGRAEQTNFTEMLRYKFVAPRLSFTVMNLNEIVSGGSAEPATEMFDNKTVVPSQQTLPKCCVTSSCRANNRGDGR